VRDRLEEDDAARRLWREDPARVAGVHRCIVLAREEYGYGAERAGAARHDPRRTRSQPAHPQRRGPTVTEIAQQAGMRRETLAALMEHHGYLVLAPYGGTQRRRLVSQRAIAAGMGHNVDASRTRIARLEGYGRAAVFPIFYAECVPDILWTLDLEGIRQVAREKGRKRERLVWLLDKHGYLPDAEVADIAGCTERTVRRARAEQTLKMSYASYIEDIEEAD
jgi:hypothetical protein